MMIHYIHSNHECDSKGKRLNLFHSVDCNLVIPCEIEMIACQNSIIVNEQALSQPDPDCRVWQCRTRDANS